MKNEIITKTFEHDLPKDFFPIYLSDKNEIIEFLHSSMSHDEILSCFGRMITLTQCIADTQYTLKVFIEKSLYNQMNMYMHKALEYNLKTILLVDRIVIRELYELNKWELSITEQKYL